MTERGRLSKTPTKRGDSKSAAEITGKIFIFGEKIFAAFFFAGQVAAATITAQQSEERKRRREKRNKPRQVDKEEEST